MLGTNHRKYISDTFSENQVRRIGANQVFMDTWSRAFSKLRKLWLNGHCEERSLQPRAPARRDEAISKRLDNSWGWIASRHAKLAAEGTLAMTIVTFIQSFHKHKTILSFRSLEVSEKSCLFKDFKIPHMRSGWQIVLFSDIEIGFTQVAAFHRRRDQL